MSFAGSQADRSSPVGPDATGRRVDPAGQSPLAPLAVVLPTLVYALLASQHPLLSTSMVVVLCLTLLFMLSLGVLVGHPNRDPLDPLRLASLIFLGIYCIAPMFANRFDWFYIGDERVLLERSTYYVLGGFVFLCAGYALGPSLRPPQAGSDVEPFRQPAVQYFGLALFGIGLLAYIVGIVSAGGLDRLFASEESRVQFFKGIGWLYWASFFMVPGGVLYFAAATTTRPRIAWLFTWPLLTSFVALILLQGRFRALRALICMMVLWHYRVRSFRARELSVLAVGGFAFFIFVGYARHPDIRPYLLTDPIGVVAEVAGNFFEYSQGIVGDAISRIPQVMLGFDAFPARVAHKWGETILVAFNPILRIVGLSDLQTENTGTIFFHLARPEFPPWLETGYHTSLAGELLANFPWYLALPFFAFYGFLLRSLYAALRGREYSLSMGSLYAIVIFPVLSMLIVGIGLVLFEIAVVTAPLLLVKILQRRTPSIHASSGGSGLRSPTEWGAL